MPPTKDVLTFALERGSNAILRFVPRTRQERATVWLQVWTPVWTTAYRLEQEAGVFVVAEVRIYPSGRRGMLPDEWRQGTRVAAIPSGGLPARVARDLMKFDRVSKIPRAIVQDLTQSLGVDAFAADGPLGAFRIDVEETSSGRGRSDREYAKIAEMYVKAVAAGEPPAPVIAKRMHVTQQSARDLVRKARDRKLLTASPRKNRPGGILTPKAEKLLRKAKGTQ